MSRCVVRNHDLRREIAEYVLNCSDNELFNVICALDGDDTVPKFFSCEKCTELFGKCSEELLNEDMDIEVYGIEECIGRIHKYEEMRDNG